jgi:hypothetical protein
MSITTTWTTSTVPARRYPEQREAPSGPRPAWDCANCSLLNAGIRRRCADCGTSRD